MVVGLVAIGRNEGERLRRCLQSAVSQVIKVVYVDSGSTDSSREVARMLGADVVELDLQTPFTAARARNEGYCRLRALMPSITHVQFVDGDCELDERWIERATAFSAEHPDAAAICGRRRERFPSASVYNYLCDVEWNTPIGKADACGGDALMRVDALEQVGGYDASLIAGEEPELCARLRLLGWEIWRIDQEMTWHDAAMHRAGQWWQRARRAGHAYAEVNHRHGGAPLRLWTREVRSTWFWGAPFAWPAWPLLWWRVYRHKKDAAYATSVTLAKLPQLIGQLEYWSNRVVGKRRGLIEYK